MAALQDDIGPEQWQSAIRAVAFDMDGLMVNTESIYTMVGDAVLNRRGKEFTPELKKKMMGLPGNVAFQVMIDHASLTDSIETLARESEQVFEDLLPRHLALLPGLLELLAHLDGQRMPRCVATSSSRKFAQRVLELVGVQDRFDFVITAEDVENGKPAPDIYRAAAQRMGVTTPSMMVLEDSHHGSRAGHTSGACTIAVPGEHSRDHDFAGVHAVVDSLLDSRIYAILEAE